MKRRRPSHLKGSLPSFTDPLIVQTSKRYCMRFRNESGDTHPLHLHRHSFEITNILGKLTGGVTKDVVLVNPFSTAESILSRTIRV